MVSSEAIAGSFVLAAKAIAESPMVAIALQCISEMPLLFAIFEDTYGKMAARYSG
jgi:hypothetical protein